MPSLTRRCMMSLLALTVLAGCRGSEPALTPPPSDVRTPADDEPVIPLQFADVTRELGIDFTYRNGQEAGVYSIVESLGGGVAMTDFDLDGWLDLCLAGGGGFHPERKEMFGLPPGLFRSEQARHFTEVTTQAGIATAPYCSHGFAAGDYDNDGFPDLLITGYGGLLLWHNQGDGTFQEVAQATGLTDKSWSTSAGWGDLNGDGNLDLYVAHYVDWSFDNNPQCGSGGVRDVCSPRQFEGLDDVLYFSNGDGTFRDASHEAGLVAQGKGLGVLLGDVDNDGDLDIYVANDTVDNFLYLNDGRGHLQETGLISGTAVDDTASANGSMGTDLGDYNLDGLPDLWVANYEDEAFALYRNEGQGQFLFQSGETGISSLGGIYVGFGTAFADLDRDGDEDLVVANGHAIRRPKNAPVRQQPLVLRNQHGRFERVNFAEETYLGQPHHGRGLAIGDLDHDGDLDLVFTHNNEPATVLRNNTSSPHNWLSLRLIGRIGNRDAVGTRVVVSTSDGDQMRQVKGGTSYLSHSDWQPFWGVPSGSKLREVVIYWPSGQVQRLPVAEPNRLSVVVELKKSDERNK